MPRGKEIEGSKEVNQEQTDFQLKVEEVRPKQESTVETGERLEREDKEMLAAKTELEREFSKKIGDKKGADNVPVSEIPERTSKPGLVERAGIGLGKIFSWLPVWMENRTKGFNVERFGVENLKELEDRSYILAANHIMPKNVLLRSLAISPDSSIIKRVIEEETRRTPNAIANVASKLAKIPILGYLDKIWAPFREGLMEGMGFIPVKMRRDGESSGFNRNFVRIFRESIDRNEPIIIFPQGHWTEDHDPNQEFETGAATLSRTYELPIVPVYISGGRTWSRREKASVSFGEVIMPQEKDKNQITSEIREAITQLKEEKS